MKKVSLLFTISFLFFVLGQILWSIRLFNQFPVFGNGYIDDFRIYNRPLTADEVEELYESYE